MSDSNQPVGFARGGTPNASQAGQAGQAGLVGPAASEGASQDRTITLAEAQRLIQDAVDRSLRASQSLTDKSEARIRKDIQDRLNQIDQARKTFEAAGVQITPEINEKIRRQVIDDSLLGDGGVLPGQGQPAQGGREQPLNVQGSAQAEPQMAAAANDPISQTALTMMQEAGVTVLDTDPEAAALDYSSPRAFLRTLDQAIEAKRARIGQDTAGMPQQPGTQRAPTNLGAAGTRTGLMEQYQAEMNQNKNLPQHMRLEIRRKYRRLGLNV